MNAGFFAQWGPDMAYVLGVVCADGCLVEHRNGHHGLDITSNDRAWLEQIKGALQAQQRITPKRHAYRFEVRNQALYRSLLQLGLTPRKSKTLRMPKAPSDLFRDFVRGYFDGDGCVRAWQERRWGRSWQLRTTFTSGSLDFLQSLQERLHREAVMGRGAISRTQRAHRLQYAIQDSVQLYDFMYGGHCQRYLARKRTIFERFLVMKGESLLLGTAE